MLAWCYEIDGRIHGTTGERPCDLLPQEKRLPLPSPDKLAKYVREERKVSMDGFVSFDGVRYGVPWQYSGRVVTVRQLRNQIEIWSEGTDCGSREVSSIKRSRAVGGAVHRVVCCAGCDRTVASC